MPCGVLTYASDPDGKAHKALTMGMGCGFDENMSIMEKVKKTNFGQVMNSSIMGIRIIYNAGHNCAALYFSIHFSTFIRYTIPLFFC